MGESQPVSAESPHEDVDADDEEEESIEMNWNLMEYLVEAVRDPFAAAVAGFISAAHTQHHQLPGLLRGEMSQKLFQ